MEIVPALLEKSAADLAKQLDNLYPYFSHFQIDIADGRFVPNKTVRIEDLKLETCNLELFSLDFHLMVNDPESEVKKLNQLADKNIQIQTIFVHLKPFKDSKIINHKSKFIYGIVLNPEEGVDENWEMIKQFPAIQIMSVHPGFQGAAFLPETLKKISQLRKRGFGGQIYLDGGINDQTLPFILNRQARPDVLCVGSYLKENPASKLKLLQSILKINQSTTTAKAPGF